VSLISHLKFKVEPEKYVVNLNICKFLIHVFVFNRLMIYGHHCCHVIVLILPDFPVTWLKLIFSNDRLNEKACMIQFLSALAMYISNFFIGIIVRNCKMCIINLAKIITIQTLYKKHEYINHGIQKVNHQQSKYILYTLKWERYVTRYFL
jgi:hypothetical protein